MRWFVTLPLLIGALSACEEDATIEIDDRDPIVRPFDPLDGYDLGPGADPLFIPVIAPEQMLDLGVIDSPVLFADPRVPLEDLDGDEFPDVVLVIDYEGLDPIDLVDEFPGGVLVFPRKDVDLLLPGALEEQ